MEMTALRPGYLTKTGLNVLRMHRETLLSFLGLIQLACLICFLVSDYINLGFQIYLHLQVPK